MANDKLVTLDILRYNNEKIKEQLNTKIDIEQGEEIRKSIAELPTKDYVADEISKAALGGGEGGDLSGYATKEYVDEALKDVDLTGYATETYVGEKIAEIEIPSLDGYAKEEDIPDTSNFVEKETLSDYAKKTDLHEEYDDTALSNRVKANEDAISILNGTGDGSVGKTVDNALNDFATKISNDSVVNTYKELVDYAAEHSADIVEMAGDIADNANDIDAVDSRLVTVETNLGGHTVGKDVPSNAKFTDTTYTEFGKSGADAKSGLVPAPSTTEGATKFLREDGTWVVPTNTTYTNAKLGNGYANASNAANATAITVSLSSYTLSVGGDVAIRFQNAVPANATLNINSKGAKPIYNGTSAITKDIIGAGDIGTFKYDGTNYNLVSVGHSSVHGLMSAVARSANSIPNNPGALTDSYEIVGTTGSSLMRFSPKAIADYVADGIDFTNALTNLVANTPTDSVTASEYYLSFASDGSPSSKVTLTNLLSRTASNVGITPGSASGNKFTTHFYPQNDGSIYLGQSNYRFSDIWSKNGVQTTSDRNMKKDVVSLDAEKTVDFITGLNPTSYKLIDGTSDRTHYGLIAQEVEELLERLGIDTKDFAGLVKAPKQKEVEVTLGDGTTVTELVNIDGEYNYFLRYEQFIAPLIKTVQTQQKQIDDLKAIVEELRYK